MKKIFIIPILFVFSVCCYGESVTIVKNSATEYISNSFDGTSKYWVTELKIVGELNGKDVQFIREIATSESNGNLSKLDLSEASFVDVDGLDEVFENITLNKDLWSSKLADGLQYRYHKLYDSYSSEKHHSYFFGYYVVWKEVIADYVRIYELEKFDVNCLSGHFFDGCDKLTSIILPSKTKGICDGAFNNCVNLTDLDIPEEVTFIGDKAFNECSSLTSIILPTSVSSIGRYAFNNCKGLTSMDLSFVKELNSYAFNECSNLENVKLCEQMTEIPFGAFYYCKKLSKVNLPKSTEKIDTYAFYNCGLEEVIIPEKVTEIENNAFFRCPFKKIYALSKSPSSCGTNPFTQSGFDVANNCILYVPKGCVERYSLSPGWSVFQNIKEISDGDILPQCSTPSIFYIDGCISFSSSLSTANYHYTITTPDSKSGIALADVDLSGYYNIMVYASADGYRDSETISAKLYWINEDISDPSNINTIKKRGVMIKTNNGNVEISGLDNNEEVSFYSIDGMLLGKANAIGNTAQFTTAEKIIIAKFKNSSIKIVVG